MVRILIRAMKGERQECLDYLSQHLPQAEWVYDKNKNAMTTFLSALEECGEEACLHMEEDIFLTENFYELVQERINERPHEVIQFFSMREADISIGSRYDNNFCMNQCFYLPPGYSKKLYEFYDRWRDKEKHPTGYDLMLNDFLKERKEKYWISIPSLVDHREGKSLINVRRSSKRQSKTFTNRI